jgi:hypothetical protein
MNNLKSATMTLRDDFERWVNANPGYTYFDAYQSAHAKQQKRIDDLELRLKQVIGCVPEAIKMQPFQTVDRSNKNFKAGWNFCRNETISALTATAQEG